MGRRLHSPLSGRCDPRAWALLVLLLLPLCQTAAAETEAAAESGLFLAEETEYLLLPVDTRSVVLSHPFIDPGSVRVRVEGVEWRPGADFRVSAGDGIWLPLRSLGDTGSSDRIVRISYRFSPAPLRSSLDLHSPFIAGAAPDSSRSRQLAALPSPPSTLTVGQLDVRGSKTVRMSSGNRRELTVDQTLRLAISGRLTEDIFVRAALTDDNLPVVPEGNTEELRDVDQILVELTAPGWRATLGDFVAVQSGSALGGYRRKLQGVSLSVGDESRGAEVLAGSPRGLYRTIQIRGEEANQGPYFLGPGDSGAELFIVAGSERVRLDGEVLTRGADQDYVVDYVRGTVTFTYRRLITADSEIAVELEQGEGPYARTVVGGGVGSAFTFPGTALPGTMMVRIVRERDDAGRLRNGELSAADEQKLATAGDDPDLAVSAGVVQREPGEGRYRRGVLDGVDIWIYDPAAGDYDVSFYHSGSGSGDYDIDSLTVFGELVYGYRGPTAGTYRVGRPLEVPTSHSLATAFARFGAAAGEGAGLSLEGDLSKLDRNTLSELDDDDNSGGAWRLAADLGSAELRPAGASFGRIGFGITHEQHDSRFSPFLIRRDIFDYDRWGLGDRSRQTGFLDEKDAETLVQAVYAAAADTRSIDIKADWGRLRHGASLESHRIDVGGTWRYGLLAGEDKWGEADSEDVDDPLDVFRKHQFHEVELTTGVARPRVGFARQQYVDDSVTGGAAAGYRLRSWNSGLASALGRAFVWDIDFRRELADSMRSGNWDRERDSRTGIASLSTPAWAGMRLTADGTVREVRQPDGPDQTTRLAKIYLNGAWPGTGSDWSLQYGVDNSRTEVLDRKVVFIGERLGDYNEDGDFVGRNLGDYNVVTVGTDSLVATTEVTADLTWRQDFAKLGRDRFWGAWDSYTRLMVGSRSREPDAGRLLLFAPGTIFDSEQTVLGQVSLRQELHLLRNLRRYDLRLNYDFDQALDRQYATNPEDRLQRSYEGVFTAGLGSRTSLSFRGRWTGEQRFTSQSSGSNRSYDSRTIRGESEISWRPGPGDRLALAAEIVSREDAVSGVQQDEVALRPSTRIKAGNRWSGSLELRLASVDSREPAGSLRPYFYPVSGVNQEINARLGWEPTRLMTVTLSWFGRCRGDRGWQHDVRLESTARF